MIGYADVLAKTGEAAKSGPIGLAVILVLCVLCYFLFKSMSKHLRSVREGFPKDGAPVERTGTSPEAADRPASPPTPPTTEQPPPGA